MRRTAPHRALPALLLLAATACAAGTRAAGGPSPQAEIVALLQASADEWNRGNLEGFLLPYLDSPETTYVGSRGLTRGKAAIRESYQTSWFRGGAPAGTLAFRDIEVRPLGPDHALAVGRWFVVGRADGREQSGMFSLTLRRTPEGWRIVHDHSS